MSFFVPDVRFVLHRSGPAENEGTALATRGRALEATLLDYLRRKELNRSAQVRILRNEQHFETLRLIVRPSGTVHENPLPEKVPGIVEDAVAAHRRTNHGP